MRSGGGTLVTAWGIVLALGGGCSESNPDLVLSDGGVRGDLSTVFPAPPDQASQGCRDGVRGEDETDIDCGGARCPACGADEACRMDRDCQSAICLAGYCTAGPSCADQRRNGDETDIDCGGMVCAPCDRGAACKQDRDCVTQVCFAQSCSPRLTLSFAMPTLTDSIKDCWGIVAGDLDGDRLLDVAVGSYGGGAIQPLYGKGDGSFVAGTPTDPIGGLRMLAAADFDLDGRDDVVVNNSGTPRLFLGGPNRTLQAPRMLPAGGGYLVATGDWNGDQKPDLVSGANANFSLFLGDGKGGFAAPVSSKLGGAAGAVSVATGDLDHDGRTDVLATFQDWVVVANGVPNNGFWNTLFGAGPPVRQGGTAAYGPGGVGDFDHDGVLDVVAYATWPSLFVYRGDGKGGFVFPPVESTKAPDGYEILLVADFDHDGYDDVVLGNRESGKSVSVWRGGPGGHFVGVLTLPTPDAVRSVAVGDWNGDGRTDIAVAVGFNSPQVALYLNTSK